VPLSPHAALTWSWVRFSEIGKIRRPQGRAHTCPAPEVGGLQVRPFELGSGQQRAGEVEVGQVGALQVGAAQIEMEAILAARAAPNSPAPLAAFVGDALRRPAADHRQRRLEVGARGVEGLSPARCLGFEVEVAKPLPPPFQTRLAVFRAGVGQRLPVAEVVVRGRARMSSRGYRRRGSP